jgi:hypothetical protein
MEHRKSEGFRRAYDALPDEVRSLADKSFRLLKEDPKHPALRFKKVGPYSSAHGTLLPCAGRGAAYGLLWFWIGHHSEYERLIG